MYEIQYIYIYSTTKQYESTKQYETTRNNTKQHDTIQYNTTEYNAIQYNAQHNTQHNHTNYSTKLQKLQKHKNHKKTQKPQKHTHTQTTTRTQGHKDTRTQEIGDWRLETRDNTQRTTHNTQQNKCLLDGRQRSHARSLGNRWLNTEQNGSAPQRSWILLWTWCSPSFLVSRPFWIARSMWSLANGVFILLFGKKRPWFPNGVPTQRSMRAAPESERP